MDRHGVDSGAVLILPPGHAQQILAPRRLGRRERYLVGVVGAVAATLAIVVVVALASSGHTSARGCVDVNLPYSTGGAEIYVCGARARSTCASVARPGGFTGAAAQAVATQCRKAGVPVSAAG